MTRNVAHWANWLFGCEPTNCFNNLIQGEPDLNWQLRCRRPPCSQLHYPLMELLLYSVERSPSKKRFLLRKKSNFSPTTSLPHMLNFLLLPTHCSTLLQIPSIASRSVSHKKEGGFSSTDITSDSISVWVFAARGKMIYSFSWSHKSLVLVSFRIGIWSFYSFCRRDLPSHKLFHFRLLLLGLHNSLLVGSCHQSK